MGLEILLLTGGGAAVLVGLLFLWRAAWTLLAHRPADEHLNALLEFEEDDILDRDSAELVSGYGRFARRDLILAALLWLVTIAVGLGCIHLAGAGLGWWPLLR
jgi:hypothetical protein